MKKTLFCLLLVFALALPAAADPWLYLGDDGTGFQVWLDRDTKPVARALPDGKMAVIPGMFTYGYKMGMAGKDQVPTSGVVDRMARRTLAYRESGGIAWRANPKGGDSFLFSACLIKDYQAIMAKTPFLLKEEYIPKERAPEWGIDEDGWQKVYEYPDGGQAWVETRSSLLTDFADGRLPGLRVFVRRLEPLDGGLKLFYSYESYDPDQKTRTVLVAWDAKGQPLKLEKQEPTPVLVLSKEASIATVGYNVFAVDPEEGKKRGFFLESDPLPEFNNAWLGFKVD